MDPTLTQDNRAAALNVPKLGKDKLLLTRVDVVEGLSELFEIRVECLSPDSNIDFNPALGENASVRLRTVGKKTRQFSGVLVEAGWDGDREALASYYVVLRPWLWLLTHTRDSRIFQNMKLPDIIAKVFSDAGFSDFEFELSESYDPIEYCVQYNESHFDFVSRLMERYGIYYYFKHTATQHVMVMVDRKSSHKPIPDLPKVTFVGQGERTRDDKEFLRDWTSERRFQTGRVTVNAFDFVKPLSKLLQPESDPGGYKHDKMERYIYPHKYKQGQESDLGTKFALSLLQSGQTQDRRRHASGDAPSLFPGGTTTLEKHPMASENKEYLVVRASHSFVAETFRSGGGGGDASGDSYFGHYVLQLASIQFRAPHLTPRPIIHGPQTAKVVGKKGEEIDTDEHGRVKLKFPWDRAPGEDENSSRWVRVAHHGSGKGWGSFYIPRIGEEVVVEHIEGDPDRPLVVGTVYNGENKMPYAMPANKTQRGLKTRSTKNGSPANFNELIFEDKKGQEFVRFHAEKDYIGVIENTSVVTINGKGQKGPTEMSSSVTVDKGDVNFRIKDGDHNEDISRDHNVKIGRDEKVTTQNDYKYHALNTIEIKADVELKLVCGGSTITMTPGSISIESTTINVKAGATLNEQAPMINVKADGILTQKGGMILIN